MKIIVARKIELSFGVYRDPESSRRGEWVKDKNKWARSERDRASNSRRKHEKVSRGKTIQQHARKVSFRDVVRAREIDYLAGLNGAQIAHDRAG